MSVANGTDSQASGKTWNVLTREAHYIKIESNNVGSWGGAIFVAEACSFQQLRTKLSSRADAWEFTQAGV